MLCHSMLVMSVVNKLDGEASPAPSPDSTPRSETKCCNISGGNVIVILIEIVIVTVIVLVIVIVILTVIVIVITCLTLLV